MALSQQARIKKLKRYILSLPKGSSPDAQAPRKGFHYEKGKLVPNEKST